MAHFLTNATSGTLQDSDGFDNCLTPLNDDDRPRQTIPSIFNHDQDAPNVSLF